MSVRLREADARAVDLMLDRAVSSALASDGSGNGNGALYAATHAAVSNEHVSAVERVLNLLNVMPAAEPPQDLLQRTLDRVAAHTGAPMRAAGVGPALVDTRPHA